MSDTNTFTIDLENAKFLDEQDPIKSYRHQFFIAEPDVIYLDGNSLGRLPKQTLWKMQNVVEQHWGTRLIRNWNEEWYQLPEKTSEKIAQIIGAGKDEVATGDSTSVNLYKAAMAAMLLRPGKTRIVSDDLNFPTDLYILQGIVKQLGPDYELVLAHSEDGMRVEKEALEAVINHNTALVVLSHVAFKSAFMYDMKATTAIAHGKGALMLWDLSHSAGAVPVALNESAADFAVGCTYKHLNGGPGSPAYIFASRHLHNSISNPIWGWFGAAKPFEFDLEYSETPGIRKFMVGTPPILSLAATETGLDITLKAGIKQIRKKSVLQTEYLLFLWRSILEPLGFELGSPEEKSQRGSHLSLRHPEAYRICKALINPQDCHYKIIPDFRAPNLIRIGITPLYTTFEEIFIAVKQMQNIVAKRNYEDYSKTKETVT